MTERFSVGAGRDQPLGVTLTETGANVAVYSEYAEGISLCLFDDSGDEIAELPLPERIGHVWCGHVEGLREGQIYGLRASGPYSPSEGQRFNSNKLLLDPYARQIIGPLEWSDILTGGKAKKPDPRDSASAAPKAVLVSPPPRYDGPRPRTDWRDTVIYEAHLEGLTRQWPGLEEMPPMEAVTSPQVLEHLQTLGVTAIEFLPVHAFMTDRFLVERGLRNYWGYQSIGFFAPHPPYLGDAGISAFAEMVRRFHEARIEVLLDVVYNHTAEGDGKGPTVSFRGLDNRNYYRLLGDNVHYDNLTGTGNAMRTDHPVVQRLILDSLRYWVEFMGVDGFRFDLGATLGREEHGFTPRAGLFDAMLQDPVLSQVKLIAEPWDIGPGGYQLGQFPHPFAEWNDQFRDGVRRYWKGDRGMVPALAEALAGTAHRFDRAGRMATSSINLITAHDGFTLADLTSFNDRHNEANGEDGRDGHGANFSDNMGHEGQVEDAAIIAARLRRRKNLLATLFLAQGTPMLLAGDEAGNSQDGNNNAYAQGNATGWVRWDGADLRSFVAALTALRRRFPVLRQSLFLHSERRPDGKPDLIWRCANGSEMQREDWLDQSRTFVAFELRAAAETPVHGQTEEALYLVFNSGEERTVSLPAGEWVRVFATAEEEAADETTIPASSVAVFERTA
ncbi:glycogen debranching protein GlgX [Algicella marina]|nr:glycogen debranching protein GlgX [Algicella marina]